MREPLTKKKILVFVAMVVFLSIGRQARAGLAEAPQKPQLIVFFSPSCHRCLQAKADIIPKIENEFSFRVSVAYRDINDIENYKLLITLRDQYDPKLGLELPLFFFGGKFVTGKGDILSELKELLSSPLVGINSGILPSADLVQMFKRFKVAGIILAGLGDGINPCAFTVIVFFISFLALQGYRRKELVVIGLTFIFSVFLTYLLVGLGIFNFLYRMKGFWVVTKTVNLAVGSFSVILGGCALYDFFKFRKTKETEGLLLQLPNAVKNQIHKVIGMHYRKPRNTVGSTQPNMFRLVISALITGFLVSLLEAVCTGQLYLPTITFILKTAPLKLHAGLYLLLYNMMFVVPLCVVFSCALLGATSEDFAKFLKNNLGAIKIAMALLFFALGAFLIWRA